MKKSKNQEELIFDYESFFTVKLKDNTKFKFYFREGTFMMEQLLKDYNIPFKIENRFIGEKSFNWGEEYDKN